MFWAARGTLIVTGSLPEQAPLPIAPFFSARLGALLHLVVDCVASWLAPTNTSKVDSKQYCDYPKSLMTLCTDNAGSLGKKTSARPLQKTNPVGVFRPLHSLFMVSHGHTQICRQKSMLSTRKFRSAGLENSGPPDPYSLIIAGSAISVGWQKVLCESSSAVDLKRPGHILTGIQVPIEARKNKWSVLKTKHFRTFYHPLH